ncbi:MAG: hypothetical protein JRI68_16890 [Deltaproteobacteria bacterium]|nr:hypothetical protein [Deltaproteobacteria bacterium]
MTQVLAAESKPVALQLHGLLRDLDPAHWDGMEGTIRGRVATLEYQLSRVLAATSRSSSASPRVERPTLRERLREIVLLLREHVPQAGLSAAEVKEAWAGFRKQLQHAYEALSVSLQAWSVHVPSLRPTNHVRNVFHAFMGLGCVVLVEEVLSGRGLWLPPLMFAVTFWCLEGLRNFNAHARALLLWIFKVVAHPHERYRVNSATWFTTALVVVGYLFEPMICAVAVVILGLADPAAAVIGRRFGKIKLVNGRTLEGSTAFFVVGTLAAIAVLAIWHGELSPFAMVAIAVGASLPAALVELYTRLLDDNFAVPVSAALGGWATTLLLGLS